MATFFELFCECKDSLQKYEQALSEARVLSLSNDTESGHLTAFVRFPRLVSDRMLCAGNQGLSEKNGCRYQRLFGGQRLEN